MNGKDTSCAECGAALQDSLSCRDMLALVIGWESEDEELLKEHFKAVASFNLQHPSCFRDDAVAKLRAAFIDHLEQGLAASAIRRRMAFLFEGSAKVLKDEPEGPITPRRWKMTISDVYAERNPYGAASRVRRWAESTRSEL